MSLNLIRKPSIHFPLTLILCASQLPNFIDGNAVTLLPFAQQFLLAHHVKKESSQARSMLRNTVYIFDKAEWRERWYLPMKVALYRD
jgi:hypothetical protein